jgi:hypothetical protein
MLGNAIVDCHSTNSSFPDGVGLDNLIDQIRTREIGVNNASSRCRVGIKPIHGQLVCTQKGDCTGAQETTHSWKIGIFVFIEVPGLGVSGG